MDIVYVVREGDNNEALRYSLRSLKNIKHDNVYIVGHKPKWVKNVIHIERMQRTFNKFQNITRNMYYASKNNEISEDFMYMDDDNYIMREIDEVYPQHRGDLSILIDFYREQGSKLYVEGLEDTARCLDSLGIDRKYSYELHIPMIFNKEKLRYLLELNDSHAIQAPIFNVRSYYGNYYSIGGQHMNDVKVRDTYQNRLSWIKGKRYTSSAGVGPTGFLLQHLKDLFPDKSHYE